MTSARASIRRAAAAFLDRDDACRSSDADKSKRVIAIPAIPCLQLYRIRSNQIFTLLGIPHRVIARGHWYYLFGIDQAKADRASELLGDRPAISVQVLAEICNVASRKAKMSWPEIEDVMDVIMNVCEVVPLTAPIQANARPLAARTGYTIYDAQILAAAAASGCGTVWSENLHDGHKITDIELPLVIHNPFAAQS